jgi:hypothetical protein
MENEIVLWQATKVETTTQLGADSSSEKDNWPRERSERRD